MFLSFLFIAYCIVPLSAENPNYTQMKNFEYDCSPSAQSVNARLTSTNETNFDFSAVSRVYVLDPKDPEKTKLSACIFEKKSTLQFSFSESGHKFIRFYFLPVAYPGYDKSMALFSISIGQYTLLTTSNSSHFGVHYSSSDYIIREFCINIDGPILNVTFIPSSMTSGAYAFVNKIEIVSMPSKLYIQENVPLPLVGNTSHYFMRNFTALEMMYRLNVGGNLIPELQDAGMLRRWASDDGYFMRNESKKRTLASEVTIVFSSLVPAYTAPIEVYKSAATSEGQKRARWLFPVDSSFYYLVRLHFCEIKRIIEKDGQRVFHVYINNQTVEDHADVFHWSHGAGIPTYKDYVVDFSRHVQGTKYLSISVASINGSFTTYDGPILNGLEIFKLSDDSNNLAGLHPFGITSLPDDSNNLYFEDGDEDDGTSESNYILCSFWLLLFACVIYFSFSSYSRKQREMKKQASKHCRIFSIDEIKFATKRFSDTLLIGTGGFGKVYKGCIDCNTTNVAIKRANPSSQQGLKEFQTEVSMLSKLRHGHLVSLIGYCTEEKEMILVYDYMAQGTLRDHLCGTQKPSIPWKQRLEICIGAARGLHYLHSGAKHTIIHRDIKSTNILLDDQLIAKVSDFGLSKVGPSVMTPSRTHVSTLVKGTFGYLDPEYYRRQKLTEKSDVYSFGVVLFEVLFARPAVLPLKEIEEEEQEKANLAEWAIHCCQMGTVDQMIDPYLMGKIDPECLKTFINIARKCLPDKGIERPSMGDVLWNLELAMRQQMVVDDCQEDKAAQRDCFENSDPNPGVEFSEIMVQLGR